MQIPPEAFTLFKFSAEKSQVLSPHLLRRRDKTHENQAQNDVSLTLDSYLCRQSWTWFYFAALPVGSLFL